jgi:hypothetical protein
MKDPDAPAAGDLWNPYVASARRSLVLCGAGAIIGILVAGFGLFTARGTRTSQVPPEDAALVNNVPILMVDFIDQLRTVHNVTLSQATATEKRQTLDAMLREELYVQRGVEIGLPTDDVDVRAALVAATEGQIAADAMTALPSEQALRSWFDIHRDRYASPGFMELQEFVLSSAQSASAEQILASLRAGETPEALHLRSSGRVDDGQEFYFAAEEHLGHQLFETARHLRDGEMSSAVTQSDGSHILIMKHNKQPTPTDFSDARAQVLSDYLSNDVAQLQTRNELFLRKRADIKIAPGLL